MPSTLFRSKASSFSFQKAPYLGDSVNTALNLTPSKGWQHLPESNYCLLEALSLPGCLCFFPEHLLTLLWIVNGFVQGPQIGDVLRLKGICSPYPTLLSSDVWMEEIFLCPCQLHAHCSCNRKAMIFHISSSSSKEAVERHNCLLIPSIFLVKNMQKSRYLITKVGIFFIIYQKQVQVDQKNCQGAWNKTCLGSTEVQFMECSYTADSQLTDGQNEPSGTF